MLILTEKLHVIYLAHKNDPEEACFNGGILFPPPLSLSLFVSACVNGLGWAGLEGMTGASCKGGQAESEGQWSSVRLVTRGLDIH